MENLDSSLQNVNKQDARRVCALSKLCEVNARRVYIWLSCIFAFCSVTHLHVIAYIYVCVYICVCVYAHNYSLNWARLVHCQSFIKFPRVTLQSICKQFRKAPGPISKRSHLVLSLNRYCIWRSVTEHAEKKSNQLRGLARETSGVCNSLYRGR